MKFPLSFEAEETGDAPGAADGQAGPEYRILVFAPSANDARITVEFLERAGLAGAACASFGELAERLAEGCGTVIIADEVLLHGVRELSGMLASQPPWSDLPITLVTSAGAEEARQFSAEIFSRAALNVTVLERPFRPDTLLSTIKAAMRARRRQYEVRDLLGRLESGQTRVRGILDSISDAFMTVDAAWQITYVNAALLRLAAPLFPGHEELPGRNLWEAFPDFTHGPIGDLYRRVMAEGSQRTLEIFYQPLEAWLEIRAFPSAHALSLYIRDITSRREAEEALRLAKERAEASSEAKDRFLAVLSHELRTPLTPVLMIAGAREEDPALTPRLRSDMAMIRRNVELETKLIDDLLDLSRVTTGKLHLDFAHVQVNEMVTQVCEICRSEIEAQGLTLHLSLSPDVDGVRADPSRFQQVLWNVIKNAAKFTPRGGHITITTACAGGEGIVISVQDTGVGIAGEDLPKIFDAFEQGDLRRSREFGGLGLGLAITQALVVLHGGRISAASEGVGTGSTFTIELPSLRGQALAEVAVSPAADGAAGAAILLVEDHADTAAVLKRLLEQRGYTVMLAGTVAEAKEIADKRHFDILLSDIGLPDATGYQLVAALKDGHDFRGIAMSGFGMDEDIRKSLAAGFEKHLAKPVSFGALESAIQSLIER